MHGLGKTRILVTGTPGIGKSTIIEKLYDLIANKLKIHPSGFVTSEIRKHGEREGFEIKTFSNNKHSLLSHVSEVKSSARVGKYHVSVENLEKVAVPEITQEAQVYLIDEIGKMECFSDLFIEKIRELIEGDRGFVVTTIGQKGEGFISEIKKSAKIELIVVTKENRDEMPEVLLDRIKHYLEKQGKK